MAEELGKINKPEASGFKKGRKIYLVPLIYSGEKAPAEYNEMFDNYWRQVTEQIENLEAKLGLITRIYHESISETGEAGLKVVENMSKKSFLLIDAECKRGAQFEGMEDKELLEETIDWQRCIMIGLLSDTAARKVTDNYLEASKKRNEFIAKKIQDTLKEDEAAIVFINERHQVQFPSDIEVFRVAPPALNDIYRFLRERQQHKEEAGEDKPEK
jgi:hypothetical protein